jgi:hypothetical protein
MFGSITDKTTTGNITSFKAKHVIWLRPGGGLKILHELETIIVPANHGFVGKHIIVGKFNAALVTDITAIINDPYVDDTKDLTQDMTSVTTTRTRTH